jgi:hypothetical protein
MATPSFSSIPSKKILLTKKLMLKIDSASSTGSHGEYLKYVSFPWPPVEPAHDPKSLHEQYIAADVTGSNHTVLIPTTELCPSDPAIPFQLCAGRFPIKIAFAMTIRKAEGRTLEPAALYPPLPVFTHGQFYVYVAYSLPCLFDSVAIATIGGHRQRLQSDRLMTSSAVYREVL